MGELFGIRQNVDRPNAAVRYIQCDDRIRSSVEITDDTRFSIDLRRMTHQSFWQKLLESTQYPADDIVSTVDRVGDSNCFPATVGVERHRETAEPAGLPYHRFLWPRESVATGHSVSWWRLRSVAHRAHMLACSPQHLTAIYFAMTPN